MTLTCPRCSRPLRRTASQGLVAYVCDAHGVWQDWATFRELGRRVQAETVDRDANLLEGFVWGRLL